MNFKVAFVAIQEALEQLEGFPRVELKWRTPENVGDTVLGGLFLVIDTKTYQEEGGDINWDQPINSRAGCIILVVVPGGDVLTLLERIQAIEDKIREVTRAEALPTGRFRCRVIRVEPMYDDVSTWAAAKIYVQVGSYND